MNVMDKPKTPDSENVRYRTNNTGRAKSSPSRSSGRRKHRKLDAARLIKLLRKHGTLTLVICGFLVSVIMGLLAIELGA